jgi:hypothetical protein
MLLTPWLLGPLAAVVIVAIFNLDAGVGSSTWARPSSLASAYC